MTEASDRAPRFVKAAARGVAERYDATPAAPDPARARPGSRAARAHAGAEPAAARSEPTADLTRVKPVSETPTEAADYAALSVLYGSLLAGVAHASRDREPIPRSEVPVLSAATFALSKLIVHEKIETWLRQPFVEEHADGKRPRGRRLRYAVGELMNCTRCVGAWSALGLVALRTHAPIAGRTVTTVLAASAANDLLQSAFSLLCARANAAQRGSDAAAGDGEHARDLKNARQAA